MDWITILGDDAEAVDSLVSTLTPVARDELRRGEKKKPFRFMQWNGQSIGGVRLGVHGDTCAAQLSGEVCANSWTLLRSSPGRVTRLDLQTTLRLSEPRTGFARCLLSPSTKTRRLPPESRTRTSYSSDTRGCRIGTVGQRTNRRYMRVYDKGIEAETHPEGLLWRVELEAKRDLGAKLWNKIRETKDVSQFCYDACARSWKSAGLRWRLPASSKDFDLPHADKRSPPSAQRLAAWLRTSVAPTIPRVLEAYSVADVLDMLGMTSLATPTIQEGDDGDL